MKFNEGQAIRIAGLGFIIYSDYAVEKFEEGEDYLEDFFLDGDNVVESINKGEIIGIATGSSGECVFKFLDGEPDGEYWAGHDFSFQVPINVKGGRIIIRDLYDMLEWTSEVPMEQTLEVEDGLYSIIVVGSLQNLGNCIRTKDINLYLVRDEDAFLAQWKSIPRLHNM